MLLLLLLNSETVERTVIKPKREKQMNDLRYLIHSDNKNTDLTSLLSIIQNNNENEVNEIKNILNRKPILKPSKYRIGDIKKYNYKDIDEGEVIITGKEYDETNNIWTYEIESTDGIITYTQVKEEELKDLERKQICDDYYIGKEIDKNEEIIEIFETGFITTKYKNKNKYNNYI